MLEQMLPTFRLQWQYQSTISCFFSLVCPQLQIPNSSILVFGLNMVSCRTGGTPTYWELKRQSSEYRRAYENLMEYKMDEVRDHAGDADWEQDFDKAPKTFRELAIAFLRGCIRHHDGEVIIHWHCIHPKQEVITH